TLGHAEPAVRDLDEAVAAAPSSLKYLHLAQAHLLAGNRPAAAEALRRAKDLGLKDGEVHPLEQASYRKLLRELPNPERRGIRRKFFRISHKNIFNLLN